MEKIEIELFIHRTSDGSEKEGILYEEIMDAIYYCREALKIEKFDGKLVAENIEFIVNGIKDLQNRKFVRKDFNYFYIYLFFKCNFLEKLYSLNRRRLLLP
jgi:hypothetical protein